MDSKTRKTQWHSGLVSHKFVGQYCAADIDACSGFDLETVRDGVEPKYDQRCSPIRSEEGELQGYSFMFGRIYARGIRIGKPPQGYLGKAHG